MMVGGRGFQYDDIITFFQINLPMYMSQIASLRGLFEKEEKSKLKIKNQCIHSRASARGVQGVQLHPSIFEEDLSYTHQFENIS